MEIVNGDDRSAYLKRRHERHDSANEHHNCFVITKEVPEHLCDKCRVDGTHESRMFQGLNDKRVVRDRVHTSFVLSITIITMKPTQMLSMAEA